MWPASWDSFRMFRNRAISETRFVRNDDDAEFLKRVVETSKKRTFRLRKDALLWRAQRENNWRQEHISPGEVVEIPIPVDDIRMVPTPRYALDGRSNPAGIPVLYTANRKDTAISEIRPWIGSLVTLGLFKVGRNLRLVNCSEHHEDEFINHMYLDEPKPEQAEDAVWYWIDREFSEPLLRDEDKHFYAPTQIIAEAFKQAGFDGITYKSNFGTEGYNIALFSVADAECLETRMHKVTGISIVQEEADETERRYFGAK